MSALGLDQWDSADCFFHRSLVGFGLGRCRWFWGEWALYGLESGWGFVVDDGLGWLGFMF